MFSLWLHHFLKLSTLWKEMEIVEKEGSLPVYDTHILNTFFFFFFFFCQLMKLLPNSQVKLAHNYPSQRD